VRALQRSLLRLFAFTRPTPAAAAEVPRDGIELNIIRWWPDGFDERLERVWRDLVGFIPNYKLYDLQRMLAEFGFTMVLYEGPASPVAPAGVPTDLHQQIINLQGKDRDTVRHLYHDSVMTAYYAGHRDARHAAAELVCAVLSAGAPAVPLQDSSSVLFIRRASHRRPTVTPLSSAMGAMVLRVYVGEREFDSASREAARFQRAEWK
jgi:hypothetical protein